MSADAAVYLPSTSDLPAGTDPSAILASVSESGDAITLTLHHPTVSNTPDTAVSWQSDIVDIFGNVRDLDPGDVLLAILRVASLTVPADVHVGMALIAANGRGFAYRLAAVGAEWQVQHATRATPAGAWSAWTKGTASPFVRGVVGQFTVGTDDAQSRVNGYAVDAVGAIVPAPSTPTSPATFSGGSDFTKCRFFAGWVAGTGVTPTSVVINVGLLHAKILDFPRVASFFG